MKLIELRKKTDKELEEIVKSLKEKQRDLRFQLASGKVKNTKEIRFTKKDVAKILTILKEKQNI